MSSRNQIAANPNNAKLSTGPRTAEGKQTSSRNATRHGLTARQLVLSIEDRAEYEDLRTCLIAEHQPVGTLELLTITQIADSFWRLRRARAIETGMMERELTESATEAMTLAATWEKISRELDLLRRYTAAIERSYFRALAELRRLQAERRANGYPNHTPPPFTEPVRDHADPADYKSWRDISGSSCTPSAGLPAKDAAGPENPS